MTLKSPLQGAIRMPGIGVQGSGRSVTIAEFTDRLRTTVNKRSRPFAESTIVAYLDTAVGRLAQRTGGRQGLHRTGRL
jgi:hypothetical protein